MKRMITTLLVALAVAGCTGQAATPTSPPIPPATTAVEPPASASAPADWQRSWLRGEPCAPPCFLGITPGATTRDEAFDLMRAIFPAAEPEELPSYSGDDTMLHVFKKEPQGQLHTATAYFYTAPPRSSATPANMIVAFVTSAPDMVSFSEVIAAFGEPSHILALASYYEHSGMTYGLNAVYLDRGLMVSFDIDGGKNGQPDLAPELMAVSVIVFDTSDVGFKEGMRAYYDLAEASTLLVPWQGFQPFSTYCRESSPAASRKGCQ